MMAINFSMTNTTFTVKNVFDALRAHKEQQKYELLSQALEEDMNTAIVEN